MVVLVAPSLALAQPLRPLPPILRTVSDEVGALSRQQGRELADEIEDIRRTTGVQIVVVVAETTGAEDIEHYAERLSQRWKSARGIALERSVFVIMAVNDRALHITAGRDLESVRSELRTGSVTAQVQSLLREQNYFAALSRITVRIRQLIAGSEKRVAARYMEAGLEQRPGPRFSASADTLRLCGD